MDTLSMDQVVMELVVNGGHARSKSMEAIKAAKKGDFEFAKEKIKEANEALNNAHNFQTSLIQKEAAGEKVEISLLMVHAQDHLMNAMTVRDLAKEMVSMYEEFRK
ncbi:MULTISPECIES: PTS lactose/cellobiose transporter subunit IIA [Clostridium]|jgi:PTS system cellobiose-specific IIA component|uniref:Lichenan-specific phosphotransferase enzyme IIA component LicA n=1 Tax=Clostridium saccharoperbutylacetonicum N1-4(HMT) TaxID=931276 RepID=M1MC53_9CLOT|nr:MULTISPECIES: PTS lactose/cellobiose transporter subunit IIA [Clostridium]AGF55509.1 lichenan-specific phosphotransferase enzyme IIA component LicA [Clostridium saccharoperbutylacetonicum N1-4(HMT)]AQR94389.1 lichenan-specific phosphotransferase enzyme IIA component [Clostridium saccharoperbutylacetonicum]NRT63772.1 PTS system cellobiose-specific IIA component [Clostridium saccharoperbutylacetonicum]NSB27135.1 PTS system cellobiose-specific IIA component [Clostridium saccharoperbutylacetonic